MPTDQNKQTFRQDRNKQTSLSSRPNNSRPTNFLFPTIQATRSKSGSSVPTAQPGPLEEPHSLRNLTARGTKLSPRHQLRQAPETTKCSTRTFGGTSPPEEPCHKKHEALPPSQLCQASGQETRATTTHIRDYFGKLILFFYICDNHYFAFVIIVLLVCKDRCPQESYY